MMRPSPARSNLARLCLLAGLGLLCLPASGCEASRSDNPAGPSASIQTVTITAAGVSPKALQVQLGDRVRFVNNSNLPHLMGSDPHPEHTDCPDLNQVGYLLPGQGRETGNLVQARTCGYHDHDRPDVTALRGTITIR